MSVRAEIVTLDEFIECAAKVGLSARKALELAREHGYRVDNGEFFRLYREAKLQWAP